MAKGIEFEGKRVLVIGLGRSGRAAIETLRRLGAKVMANDRKPREELGDIADQVEGEGIKLFLGDHPVELLDRIDLVVTSPGVPKENSLLAEARRRGIPIWGEVELAYRISRAPFIAVTGTKGKSTTSMLIGEILKQARFGRVVTAGNIGTALSKEVMDLDEDDLIVAEVSSFQLETIELFRPTVAVMLNIYRDHMDRHRDMEEYISAKSRIFENQTQDDLAVINADDPIVRSISKGVKSRVIPFSVEGRVEGGVYLEDGWLVSEVDGRKVRVVPVERINLIGRHNLSNISAAVAVGMLMGVGPREIAEAVSGFHGIEGALEIVARINGVTYINDTKATNVAATKAALEALSGGVVLIMGGVDKGNDYDPLKGMIGEKVEHLILLGPNVGRIKSAFEGICPMHSARDMDEAVEIASSLAKPGGYVLLSPANASFDLFRDYRERGERFKEAVNAIHAGR
jgi:UDP-N-acetylmuramoylalanine--D-glutamate ligase